MTDTQTTQTPTIDQFIIPILDSSVGLIIAFYDRGTVAGYNINPLIKSNETVFGFNTHIGKALSVSIDPDSQSKFFFSGGSDTDIRVYDRARRKIATTLAHHTADVTHLIATPGNLISGSRDGLVAIWKCPDWVILKTLPRHIGGVASMALHPSYKILLTTDLKGTLFLWNILNGTFVMSVPDLQLSLLNFSPSGSTFAGVKSHQHIYVMDPITCQTICSIYSKKRIIVFQYLTDSIILIGDDLGQLILWDFSQKLKYIENQKKAKAAGDTESPSNDEPETVSKVIQVSLKSRIKDLVVLWSTDDNGYIVCADSNGSVEFYLISEILSFLQTIQEDENDTSAAPKSLFTLETDQRIMSISVCKGDIFLEAKRQKRDRTVQDVQES